MPWRAGMRDSPQDAVALTSAPHVLAGQQPGVGSQGSLHPPHPGTMSQSEQR